MSLDTIIREIDSQISAEIKKNARMTAFKEQAKKNLARSSIRDLQNLLEEITKPPLFEHSLLQKLNDEKKHEMIEKFYAVAETAIDHIKAYLKTQSAMADEKQQLGTQKYEERANYNNLLLAANLARSIREVKDSIWCCMFSCTGKGAHLQLRKRMLEDFLAPPKPNSPLLGRSIQSK